MTTAVCEQETTIVIMRDQPEAKIYSCDPTFQTKMRKAGHKSYRVEGDGLFWKIPKNLITIRTTPKPLTPQQQTKRLESARRMRQNVSRLGEKANLGNITDKEGL